MANIVTRTGKGTPLTTAELDANFTNLNAELATVGAAEPALTAIAAALHRSPNAVTALHIYDTSKDSDGGAWTEKCQHTSWYNEPMAGKWLGAVASEFDARHQGAQVSSVELAPNNDFNADTDWTKAAGVTISGGAARFVNVAAATGLTGPAPLTNGKTYAATFTISGYVAGGISVVLGSNFVQLTALTNGTFTLYGVSSGTGLNFRASGTATYNIESVSVREVIALTTSSNDYFQLSTDGKFYRLWKNFLPHSEAFDNAVWAKTNVSVTANSEIAPDGTLTADSVIENTALSSRSVAQTVTALTGLTYTFSCYAKSAGRSWIRMALPYTTFGESGGARRFAWFDLSSGVVGGASDGVTARIENAGNGWYRCSMTKLALGATTTAEFVAVAPATADTASTGATYQGDGTSGILVWGAQFETSAAVTAYESKSAVGTTSEIFRGNKRDFPRLAGIVAEATSVTIYDLTEVGRPMWMRFSPAYSGGDALGFWNGILQPNSVFSINGQLLFTGSTNNAACGLAIVNFPADGLRRIASTANGGSGFNIGERGLNKALPSRNTIGLASFATNAVSATVLSDAPVDPVTGLKVPTIAVATSAGVSVIQHSGAVVNIANADNAAFRKVSFPDTKRLMIQGDFLDYSPVVIEIPKSSLTGWSRTLGSPNPSVDENYVSGVGQRRLDPVADLRFLTRASGDNNASQLAVKNLRIIGGNIGVSVVNANQSAPQNGSVAYLTNAYNTGYQPGDIRRTYLADSTAGAIPPTEPIIPNGDFSTSTLVWGAQDGNMSVAIASGELAVTYNAGGASNFITGTFATKPGAKYTVTADARFGVGVFGAYLDIRVGGSTEVILNQFLTPITASGPATATFIARATSTSVRLASQVSSRPATCYWDNVVMTLVADADYSYKAQSANITGTLTKSPVATNAQLVGYSGFSTANYLREPYSADLDFGTGEWSASAWVNIPTVLDVAAFPEIAERVQDIGFDDPSKWTDLVNATVASSQLQVSAAPFSANTGSVFGTGLTYKVLIGTISGNKNFVGMIAGGGSADNYTAGVPKLKVPSFFGPLKFNDSTFVGTIDDVSVKEIGPVIVADRSHSSGAKLLLGVDAAGRLTATAFDGTTTRTVTTTAAYNTGTWNKVEASYRAGRLALSVNGAEVAVTTGAPLLSLNSRYNLLTYTEQFDNAVYVKTAGSETWTGTGLQPVITVNHGTAPDGTQTAERIEFNRGTGTTTNDRSGINSALTVQIGFSYTSSVYVKPLDSTTDQQLLDSYIGLLAANATPTSSIVDVGDGWKRIIRTVVPAATTGTFRLQILGSASPQTMDLLVWGAQVETGSAAKTYQRVAAATDFGLQAPLTIGNSYAADAPFPGSIALLKLSATVPTPEQSVWMYEQEKHMFREGAQVTLPDSGVIVDLTYDDATDKWIAVSAANESEWSGLVRTSVTPSPAGSYTKVAATSGVQALARSTTNPGVDIVMPAYTMRRELVKRAEAAARLNAQLATFDYVGGFTATTTTGSTSITSVASLTYPVSYIGATISGTGIPANTTIIGVSGTTIFLSAAATATGSGVSISFVDFILPVGHEAKTVMTAGTLRQEGATKDYTRLFDGFKETIRFGTAPGATAWVQIQTARSAV